MGRVIHFELYGPGPAERAEFYRSLFGWDVQTWEGPADYYLVTTGPQSEIGINGGIAGPAEGFDQRVVLSIAVDDVDSLIECATSAGATVVTPKHAVPGIGWNVYLADPSGTVFSAMQVDPTAGLEEAAPGAEAAGAPAGESAEGAVRTSWDEVGERLRELGASLAAAMGETMQSPQGQRVREEAERAANAVRDAGRQAADRAKPHVVAALDRVSRELGDLAARLSREGGGAVGEEAGAPTAEEPESDVPSPEEQRPLA